MRRIGEAYDETRLLDTMIKQSKYIFFILYLHEKYTLYRSGSWIENQYRKKKVIEA